MGSTCMYTEPKYLYIEYEFPGTFFNNKKTKTIKEWLIITIIAILPDKQKYFLSYIPLISALPPLMRYSTMFRCPRLTASPSEVSPSLFTAPAYCGGSVNVDKFSLCKNGRGTCLLHLTLTWVKY